MPASPSSLSVEDRRIIFAELQDVYLTAEQGYAAGHTDATVSKKLGCPQAHVAEVRDQFFGPARDNAEIRDLLQKMTACSASIDVKLREFETTKAVAADQLKHLQRVTREVDELKRLGEHLAKRAEEIRKAVE